MKVPPAGLDERQLIATLTGSWDLDGDGITYVPEGFGSYHWLANTRVGTRYFLTVDDLDCKPWLGTNRESAFAGMKAALDTAAELHEHAELAFVVAPIRTRDGDTMRRITSQYSLAVFPYIEGRTGQWGDQLSNDDSNHLVRILAELHLSNPTPACRTPQYGVSLAERGQLEGALRDLQRPWAGGPYSQPAREKLATRAETIFESLAKFDRLASEAAETDADHVITHGEPHPGNVIRAGDRFYLIDWDTVGLAPPERDLWMLDGATNETLSLYTEITGRTVNEAAISLFRLSWTLKDLAAYVELFRSNHERNQDTQKAWGGLTVCLEPAPRSQPWGSNGAC